MTTRRAQWLEDLDDLINRIADINLPDPIAEAVEVTLAQLQEDILEQIDLPSTDWDNE